jgi:AraC family transcriptional regulator, positive regulator of tynA and feaB
MERLIMLQSFDAEVPRLDFEAWRASFRASCGRYALECAEPGAFSGWFRPLSIFGIKAVDVACNENRIERTERDVRRDGQDLYGAVLQVAGRSTVNHNGQTVQLVEGDVVLVDRTRPASYVADNMGAHWLCLHFPRRPLIAHLGFEPQGGSYRSGSTPAGRLLHEFALDALKRDEAPFSPADSYMQFAIYDLVGALFVPDYCLGSRATDKLFARIHSIIRDRFADPDFGPRELAADAGISLRYVHKLFSERGSSCCEFILSLRLNHAARLLGRQSVKAQRVSEVAYACGFREYTHFARRFRRQFGYSPSSHAGRTAR